MDCQSCRGLKRSSKASLPLFRFKSVIAQKAGAELPASLSRDLPRNNPGPRTTDRSPILAEARVGAFCRRREYFQPADRVGGFLCYRTSPPAAGICRLCAWGLHHCSDFAAGGQAGTTRLKRGGDNQASLIVDGP